MFEHFYKFLYTAQQFLLNSQYIPVLKSGMKTATFALAVPIFVQIKCDTSFSSVIFTLNLGIKVF